MGGTKDLTARFVVGTGRCGSTLLSRMLAQNPATLSLFEVFNGLDPSRRFAPEPMTGTDFAALLSTPQPMLTAVLRRGYPVEEVTYPFGRGRRRRDEDLPWILVSMLPWLSDDPDALFDEVMAFLPSLPVQEPARHFDALFAWLLQRFGREHWIERAGSSIDYLEPLQQAFPGARFVHIHRDGPEAALSMREHHAFRLPICLLYDAPLDSGKKVGELGALDFYAPPDPAGEDAVSQLLRARPPARYFGRYWCDQVLHGYRALRSLDADQYLEVRFEDLVAEPAAVLRTICAFFRLDPGAWVERAAALVRGLPPPRAPNLPEQERRELIEACRPGMVLLGRA